MFRGQSVRPLELTPRNQPPGTVAENAIHPMSRDQAATSLHNPLQPNESVIAPGRVLFLTNCAPCHDSNGTGRGPVREVLRKPPADLTSVHVRQRSDGFIFWTIRNGGKQMPPYGDTMSVKEVWEVVTYVRHLQKAGGNRAER
jgi:mono/diheme cytochrome c family protein